MPNLHKAWSRALPVAALGSILLVAAGCSTTPKDTEKTEAIRWGSSFGMCVGYCTTVLEVTPTRISLTRSSRDEASHPAQTVERPTTAAEWEALRSQLDEVQVDRLSETYGCPDCADGGAEWVEIEGSEGTRRVTFEYGDSPTEIAGLVSGLRALRATFPHTD